MTLAERNNQAVTVKRYVVCLVLGVACLTQTATAQVQKPAVHLLVESLDDSAASCGLTKESITGAANSALRYNRIRLGGSSLDNLTFYVNVNVDYSAGMCSTNIDVSLAKYQEVDVKFVGEMFARVEFCNKGAMGVVKPGSPMTLQTIKDLTDACIADTSVAVLNSVS